MQALDFWKEVTSDHSNMLERLIGLLEEYEIRYCVIGGHAVNAYAEPLVGLDLDLVIAVSDLERASPILKREFTLQEFPDSLSLSLADSNLRVQIQTDSRYDGFADRAGNCNVLGITLPVASLNDLVQALVWAMEDANDIPSKRNMVLVDIGRLIESHPELQALIPQSIGARLTVAGRL